MYTLNEYGHMLADKVRMSAYMAALRRVVRPGSVVVEIGTGIGVFALAAARLGAARVYAFEPSPHIRLADRVVAANGGAPIQLIRAHSTQVQLTERADVVFSDLRGSVPVFADHFASIVDARERFLKPDGALIPQRDRLSVALVGSDRLYRRTVGVWRSIGADLDLAPAYEAQACTPMKGRLSLDDLLSSAQSWQVFEYGMLALESFSKTMTLVVGKTGTCHGIAMWFDAELWEDIGYSNNPANAPMIYGQTFFPWSAPVPVKEGDVVTCSISAELLHGIYVWRWTSATPLGTFVQSTETLPDVVDTMARHDVGQSPETQGSMPAAGSPVTAGRYKS